MSPATLKKYGIYAILSFSLSLNTYFITNNRDDMKKEREERLKLQEMLIEQTQLRREQGYILKQTVEDSSSKPIQSTKR